MLLTYSAGHLIAGGVGDCAVLLFGSLVSVMASDRSVVVIASIWTVLFRPALKKAGCPACLEDLAAPAPACSVSQKALGGLRMQLGGLRVEFSFSYLNVTLVASIKALLVEGGSN